ncbi:MAG: hypothetical protein MI799_21650 [Desulfobacterales bacterium]|nr:hypothetical protein [Desulfobacterales bacterium]
MDISKKSYQAFQEHSEKGSILELCRHIRERSPVYVEHLSDKSLFERVSNCVDAALSFNLYTKADIYSFVTLDMTTNPNFYQTQEISRLLQSSDLLEKDRMIHLTLHLPAAVWAKSYRPMYPKDTNGETNDE